MINKYYMTFVWLFLYSVYWTGNDGALLETVEWSIILFSSNYSYTACYFPLMDISLRANPLDK